MTSEYVIFAARYSIKPAVAYVLPALFERTAQMVNLPVRVLLNRATYDAALGDYLAECAHKVAKLDKET